MVRLADVSEELSTSVSKVVGSIHSFIHSTLKKKAERSSRNMGKFRIFFKMGEGRSLTVLVTTSVVEVAVSCFHFVNGFCPLFVGVIAVSLCTVLFHVTESVLLQGPARYFPLPPLVGNSTKGLFTTRPNIHLSANSAHQFGVK